LGLLYYRRNRHPTETCIQRIQKQKNIRSVFLGDIDRCKKSKVIYSRGLFTDAKKYSNKLKPKEVDWTVLFSQWLKKETKKYNFTYIETSKGKSDIQKIKQALKIIK